MDQTLEVNARISRYAGAFASLPTIKITLDGAAFDIAPKTRIVNLATHQSQTVRWTATPKSTGDHKLLLDCSDCLSQPPSPQSHDRLQVTVNQCPVDSEVLASVRLPVEVVTIWGFRQRTVSVVSYILTGIGLLISLLISLPYFPQIIGYLHRLTNRVEGPNRSGEG